MDSNRSPPFLHPSIHSHHHASLLCLYCCPLCVCLNACASYRWGRDGYVLTRQQQQQQRQPVETKAGWFIAPHWEHKSHLQRRAFKRPASWQHLPFINDWAEPPLEPETTKLTHSPSNSSFVSPLLLPPSVSFQFSLTIYLTCHSVASSRISLLLPSQSLSKYPPFFFSLHPPSSYLSPP